MAEIKGEGGSAESIQANVSQKDQVEDLFDEATAFGRLELQRQQQINLLQDQQRKLQIQRLR